MIRNRNLQAYYDELDKVGIPHPKFEKNMNVLDVGCGHSIALCDISNIVTEGNVVGIESNWESFEVSNKNTSSYNNIKLQYTDVRFIDSIDNYFDVVISIHCLQYTNHLVPSLLEIIRVLKPNGKAYLVGGKSFYMVNDNNISDVSDFKFKEYTHYSFLKEYMKNIVTVDNYDEHSGNMVVITKI
tara:strand:+ start:282 stop:836 length:555 start_codon:yes stop_codon:yes gene_type:complete